MDLHHISAATTVRFRGAKRRHAKPFIETQLRTWLAAMNIKTIYIEPGSPWLPSEATPQRAVARITIGYIESFHARFREECLNREQLWTLTEARVVIEDWRWLYNNVRPHRSLGNIRPRRFAEDAYKQGSGSIRSTPSLRPSIDFLYPLNFIINLSRLTCPVDQFTKDQVVASIIQLYDFLLYLDV